MIPITDFDLYAELALTIECYYHNKKYIVKDFVDSNDFFFICFYYDIEDLNAYYQKSYIRECMQSWLNKMPGSKILYINVNPIVSLWTDWTLGRKNYPTDSLRLMYCALLKRCAYLDTDVYLNIPLNLAGLPKTFIVDCCSGTATYSVGDKEGLKKWFLWYEEMAIIGHKKRLEPIADIEAYHKTKYVESISLNLDHFSKLYHYKRDKKPICFKESSIIKPNTSFTKECFPTLQKYLKEKDYKVVDECENVITLY